MFIGLTCLDPVKQAVRSGRDPVVLEIREFRNYNVTAESHLEKPCCLLIFDSKV
jgi:hypothetical protein